MKHQARMSAGQLAVLCIEDDADIRQIVRLALTLDTRITLYEAASAAAARELLATTGLDIDLVLLDASLPDCRGCDLVDLVHSRCPGAPVIFFTAACRSADIDRYRASGAVGIIYKPFDPLALGKHIRDALDHKGDFYVVG